MEHNSKNGYTLISQRENPGGDRTSFKELGGRPWASGRPWRGHRTTPDDSVAVAKTQSQKQLPDKDGGRPWLGGRTTLAGTAHDGLWVGSTLRRRCDLRPLHGWGAPWRCDTPETLNSKPQSPRPPLLSWLQVSHTPGYVPTSDCVFEFRVWVFRV